MTRAKAEIASRLTVRCGLGEEEAALYVGVGTTLFRELVNEGQMPRPRLLRGRRVWHVDELNAAFLSFPREGDPPNVPGPEVNPWH